MTPDEIQAAAKMWSEGANTQEIADALFVHESLVWSHLDEIKAVEIARAA